MRSSAHFSAERPAESLTVYWSYLLGSWSAAVKTSFTMPSSLTFQGTTKPAIYGSKGSVSCHRREEEASQYLLDALYVRLHPDARGRERLSEKRCVSTHVMRKCCSELSSTHVNLRWKTHIHRHKRIYIFLGRLREWWISLIFQIKLKKLAKVCCSYDTYLLWYSYKIYTCL